MLWVPLLLLALLVLESLDESSESKMGDLSESQGLVCFDSSILPLFFFPKLVKCFTFSIIPCFFFGWTLFSKGFAVTESPLELESLNFNNLTETCSKEQRGEKLYFVTTFV